MSDSLTKVEQYYLKEYDTAVQLTYHIDEMRNKLTSFYLIFSGVAVSGAAYILKSEIKSTTLKDGESLIVTLIFIVSIMGYITVLGLARLRKVQLEHFHLIARIRKHFLQEDTAVVHLTVATVPPPSVKSGSYMWLLLVMITSSSLFGFFAYLFTLRNTSPVYDNESFIIAICSAGIFFFIQNIHYFRWAAYVKP